MLSYFLLPREVVWQLAGNVAAGLVAGLALGLRWRLDAALAVVAVALLPMILWAVLEVPVAEQLQMVSQEMLNVLEENLPAGRRRGATGPGPGERKAQPGPDGSAGGRIYPFVLGVGLLGQARHHPGAGLVAGPAPEDLACRDGACRRSPAGGCPSTWSGCWWSAWA